MTVDLTRFVNDRLAEREAAASEATAWIRFHVRPDDWTRLMCDPIIGPFGGQTRKRDIATGLYVGKMSDPEWVLADIAAKRKVLELLRAMPHLYVDGDAWYSCSQAVESWSDDTEPGSGCSDDDRRGKPCDCGRDARIRAVELAFASADKNHPDFNPEWLAG